MSHSARKATTSNAEQTIPVQVGLRPETLDKIKKLRAITGEKNEAQIVAESVGLAHTVATIASEGGKAILVERNGNGFLITLGTLEARKPFEVPPCTNMTPKKEMR